MADGFSHARSIAFLLSLLFIEGVIALVGLASVLGSGGLSDAIVRGLQTAVPGPAGRILTDAVAQAHRVGTGARYVALWAALGAAIVTGTTLLGQLERGMNRLYGVEQDRPTLRKYGNAFLLLCSAGVLGALGFLCLALGNVVGSAFNNDAAGTVWDIARWPAGLLFITAAMMLILRRAPNRRQPGWSWLAMGAVLAVGLWVVVTVAVGLFFSVSSTFGRTYGPLAGIVALLLWTYASSAAVLYGVSVAAQLEAVRAGRAGAAERGEGGRPAGSPSWLRSVDSSDELARPLSRRAPVPVDERIERIRRTLEGVIGVPATEDNRLEVLRNGDEIFPSMLAAIAEAEHTIDFLTFVYWRGEIGTRFAEALAERAREGVRVRVLLDAWGAHPIDRALVELMEGGRGSRALVPTDASSAAQQDGSPDPPEGDDRGRGDRLHGWRWDRR